MYFYFIIALQGFCLYHCYQNKSEYYWFLAIIFLPLLGCLVYLFTKVFRKGNIDKVQDGIVTAINPSKRITDLEKQLQFSETFENQVQLANAYLEAQQYDKSIEQFTAALKGNFKSDFYGITKLGVAYFYNGDYGKAIDKLQEIEESPKFKKSEAQFMLGLALEKEGRWDEAETHLVTFDAPYSNYSERLTLAQFYDRIAKKEKAEEVLNELIGESERMSKQNRRLNRTIFAKAREMLNALSS